MFERESDRQADRKSARTFFAEPAPLQQKGRQHVLFEGALIAAGNEALPAVTQDKRGDFAGQHRQGCRRHLRHVVEIVVDGLERPAVHEHRGPTVLNEDRIALFCFGESRQRL